jgi:Calcineurin-like phosphoesterase
MRNLGVAFVLATAAALAIFAVAAGRRAPGPPSTRLQFVFTSDAHYGLKRPTFRGLNAVDAGVVNRAMVARINALAHVRFPMDGGVAAGEAVGSLDFVAEGGDVANREEVAGPESIQSATESWREFRADYIDGLTALTPDGRRAPVLVVPGNHDASNAVGFYRTMAPRIDDAAMVGIFNLMMAPSSRTPSTFRYESDPVFYARDIGRVHFVFVQIWPDSRARDWLTRDLSRVGRDTPVVLFTHDQPDVEAKHFRNPNPPHDINERDRFENLLVDTFADGTTVDDASLQEQHALEIFLLAHPNITAYFHGNSNWNEFYQWSGPSGAGRLRTFRVDSPMKGAQSLPDERKLSFQVATIDQRQLTMTVRECLWNAEATALSGGVQWGASATVALGSCGYCPRSSAASRAVSPIHRTGRGVDEGSHQ